MLSSVHSSKNVSAELARDMWRLTPPFLCSPSPIKSDLRVRIKYARVPSAGSTWSVRMMTLKFLGRSQCSDPVSGNTVKIAGRGCCFCFLFSEGYFCCVTVSPLLMDAGCSSFKRKEARSETKPTGFIWQRTKRLSGDQVTAMWRWGIPRGFTPAD